MRTAWEVLFLSFVSLYKGIDVDFALKRRRRYARHLFPLMGMRPKISGTIPNYPCIIMGNHRCYLDPAIVVLDVLGFPVSKAEVEKWPLIGYGAKLTGVLYLKRENADSRKRTLQGIADKVADGYPVILFPEGTTTGAETTIQFKRGGFRLAAAHNIPIIPMAIEYGSEADYWIGSSTFIPHFFERFGERKMHIWMRYGEPIRDTDADRLLEKTQNWINQSIVELKAERAAFFEEKRRK